MIKKQASQRDYQYHRALLSFIVGVGELLVLELANHNSIDPENIGVSFGAVEAQLGELRDDVRMWHGGMTAARKEQILCDVFGVSQ